MTSKTQIIENKEVTVRFLNNDSVCVETFRDIDEEYFNQAFRRIKGDISFDMGVPSFGSTNVERYEFTTLTDKELEFRNII